MFLMILSKEIKREKYYSIKKSIKYEKNYLISLIFEPPLPITEPIISLEIVISVVRVATIPGLLAVAVLPWWPKEAVVFAANVANVAIQIFVFQKKIEKKKINIKKIVNYKINTKKIKIK